MAKTTVGRAAVTALCLLAGLLGIAAVDPAPPPSPQNPSAPDAPSADPPPGELLVASAQIQDPRFYHAVILIVQHTQEGAFGIVVNHPLTKESVGNLLAAAGIDDTTVEGTIAVFAGGPVQPDLGFLVHSADYRRPATLAVDGKLAMTADKEALRDIGHHQGPKQFLFALGYAGWGPGQLEDELARKDWFVTPDDPALVFEPDSSAIWDRALARRQQDL